MRDFKRISQIELNMAISNYRKKFSGMKRTPEGLKKRTAQAVLNKRKIERYAEKKKVRPNETMKAWENRIRKFSLMSETQIQRILHQKKYVIRTKVQSKEYNKKKRKNYNQDINVYFHEKDFDFLSYYGIVLNYFSIKFGIRKVDIEICMAFYNNKIIDPNSFNNICVLNTGCSNNMLRKFVKNSYITEIVNHRKFESKEEQEVKTNMYKLNFKMSSLITEMYKIITKLNTLKESTYKGIFPKELEIEFIKMNSEIEDYLTGNKKQLNINQTK